MQYTYTFAPMNVLTVAYVLLLSLRIKYLRTTRGLRCVPGPLCQLERYLI